MYLMNESTLGLPEVIEETRHEELLTTTDVPFDDYLLSFIFANPRVCIQMGNQFLNRHHVRHKEIE